MAYGTLRIQSYAARQSAPIPEAVVVVTGDGFTKTFTTGESGTSASLAVAAPACSLSQAQGAASPPYATLTVVVKKAGYRTVTLEGVQVFAGQATLALAELVTASGEAKAIPKRIPAKPQAFEKVCNTTKLGYLSKSASKVVPGAKSM